VGIHAGRAAGCRRFWRSPRFLPAAKSRHEFRGIGTQLVQACLARLREAGIQKCHVFVVTGNTLGNAFWSSFFQKREDIEVYSQDIGV